MRDLGKESWDMLFPDLDKKTTRTYRQFLRGGFHYIKQPTAKLYDDIQVYDINSLYPSIAQSKTLPVGYAEEIMGRFYPSKERPYVFYKIKIWGGQVKEDYPAWLSVIAQDGQSVILPPLCLDPQEALTVYLSMDELNLLEESYINLEMKVIKSYAFHGMRGVFSKFVDYAYEAKRTSEGGVREYWKGVLNATFGKFSQNPELLEWDVKQIEDGVFYMPRKVEKQWARYCPVFAAICSYGRVRMVRDIHRVGLERVLYCDTDSLHIHRSDALDVMRLLDVHRDKLGAYKCEGVYDLGIYLRAKCYCLQNENGIAPTVSGMAKDEIRAQVGDIFDFEPGKVLVKTHLEGCEIVPQPFKL